MTWQLILSWLSARSAWPVASRAGLWRPMLSVARSCLNVLWAMPRDGTTYTPVPAPAPRMAA